MWQEPGRTDHRSNMLSPACSSRMRAPASWAGGTGWTAHFPQVLCACGQGLVLCFSLPVLWGWLGQAHVGQHSAARDWGERGPGQESRTRSLLARLGVQNSLARRRPPCRDIHQWERSSAAAKPIGMQRARPALTCPIRSEGGGNSFAAKSPRGVLWTRRRAERVPGSAGPWASWGRGL